MQNNKNNALIKEFIIYLELRPLIHTIEKVKEIK
jgi:hypothetical protein